MANSVEKRKYTIDFFQIVVDPTAEIATAMDGFNLMMTDEVDLSLTSSDYLYDLWGLKYRSGRSNSFVGQFRKFRKKDLEFGKPNIESQPLELGDNGLVDKNCFVFYKEHQVLGWCRNGNASTVMQFQRFLTDKWGARALITPLIKADAIKRLMNSGSILNKIEVTIPKPTNSDLIPSNDFSKGTLSLLSKSGADSMHLEMRIDTRRSDSNRSLKENLKGAVKELFDMGATTAKAVLNEDGFLQPIDLIADRVYSIQQIETNGTPPSGSIYKLIDDARNECRETINDYFGTSETAL